MLLEDLIKGYHCGLFSMSDQVGKLRWYTSRERAVFINCEVHASKSLRQAIRKMNWTVTFDEAFEETMRHCLRPDENWINEELIQVFCQAHKIGLTHSCEVWDEDHQMVGGTYGLSLGMIFSAESMFHRKTNGSKIALYFLSEKCKSLGFKLIDAQATSPHLSSLGATSMNEDQYQSALEQYALPHLNLVPFK